MNSKVNWLLQDRIIYVTLPAINTKENIDAIDEVIYSLIEGVSTPLVHVIFDNLHVVEDPGIRAWLHMKSAKHPRLGWVIDVAIGVQVIRFMSTVVTQVLKIRYRQLSTFKEAFQHLQYVDVTLPELDLEMLNDDKFRFKPDNNS